MIKYVNSHVSDTSKQMKHIKTNVNILMDTLRHHDFDRNDTFAYLVSVGDKSYVVSIHRINNTNFITGRPYSTFRITINNLIIVGGYVGSDLVNTGYYVIGDCIDSDDIQSVYELNNAVYDEIQERILNMFTTHICNK